MTKHSKHVKARPAHPQPESQASAAVLEIRPSRVTSVRDTLKRLKGVIVALAGVGAVASGFVGYYTTYKTVAITSASIASSAGAAKAADNSNSIAVLPFVNMSADKDQEYFSDGLSEELLNLLAQLPQLKVIARTSSFSFKGEKIDIADVAKKLSVGHVLEGSVRKSGNTLRITAQLIRTSDSSHLWSQTYDRQMTDVFKVQDEIAQAVVSELKLKLLPAQTLTHTASQTTDPEAFNQYLLGRSFNRQGNLDSRKLARAALQQALARAPNYAPAWAELAEAATYIADRGTDAAAIALGQSQALVAAEKAIALDPKLADGYRQRAELRLNRGDLAGALADVRQALALNAGDSDNQRQFAGILGDQGRFDEALAAAKQAVVLDPLSANALQMLGRVQVFHGDYVQAQAALTSALQLAPSHSVARRWLFVSQLLAGDVAAAQATLSLQGDAFWHGYGLAFLQHSQGLAKEADATQAALIKTNAEDGAYQIAEIYAWRGQRDKAFEWLQRAYTQHDAGLMYAKVDPLLHTLHGDARFAALVTKLGL